MTKEKGLAAKPRPSPLLGTCGSHHSSGFDRRRLPDPLPYYTDRAGLAFRERRGTWRTTRCEFHGGSDSMRVNIETGAFVCMAGCGARGGDVLAYHQASTGMDFIAAAKDLGAWVGGEHVAHHRPTPLPARAALEVLSAEINLTAIAAANLAQGVHLSDSDRARLMQAAGRILSISEMFT